MDLRVKFYYLHLKNVELELQRAEEERRPESGWDINLLTSEADGSQAALRSRGEAVLAQRGRPDALVFHFKL